MTDVDVLIVGAGPTGLTLACELAVRGVGFRIVDRADRFFGGSRADGIQPRTLEVFADIGILDAILASGDLGTVMRAYQGDEVVWEGTMSEPAEPTPPVPYPNIWFVPRRRRRTRPRPEVHGLTLNYRGGPLSRDDRTDPVTVLAGDRAPDAPATTADGRPIRLFELFRGPQWTLLAFGPALARTIAALGNRFGPALRAHTVVRPGEPADEHAVVDRDGHVRAGYDATDGTLVLVRPDGYVGLMTSDVERVAEYWTALHGTLTPSTATVRG